MLCGTVGFVLGMFEEEASYIPPTWLPLWANADLWSCITFSLICIVGLFVSLVQLLKYTLYGGEATRGRFWCEWIFLGEYDVEHWEYGDLSKE